MSIIDGSDEMARGRVLDAELSQLRREAGVGGTGATIHPLRTCGMTAEGALKLAANAEHTRAREIKPLAP